VYNSSLQVASCIAHDDGNWPKERIQLAYVFFTFSLGGMFIGAGG
jgi:hypothetical protein